MLEIKDNDNIIFEINNYSGRLGNQIGYIARSIYLAKVYRVHSIKLPKTLLTENLNIIMNETNKKNKKVIKIKKGGKYDIDKLFKNIDKNYPDIKYNRKIIKECFQKNLYPILNKIYIIVAIKINYIYILDLEIESNPFLIVYNRLWIILFI